MVDNTGRAASISRMLENSRIDEALNMGSAVIHNARRHDYIGDDDAADLYESMVGASDSIRSLERFWGDVQDRYTGPLIIDPAYEDSGSTSPDLSGGETTVEDTPTETPATGTVEDEPSDDAVPETEDPTETVDVPGEGSTGADRYDVEFRVMDDGVYEGQLGYLGRLAGLPSTDTTDIEYGVSVSGGDLDELVDEIAGIRVVGGEYDISVGEGDEQRFYASDDGYIRSLENMEVASFDLEDAASFIDEGEAYFGEHDEDGVDLLRADETDDEVVYSGSALGELEYSSRGDFAYNIQLIGDDGDVAAESGWYDEFEGVEVYDDEDAIEEIEDAYGDLNMIVPGETTGIRDATHEVAGRWRDRMSWAYDKLTGSGEDGESA